MAIAIPCAGSADEDEKLEETAAIERQKKDQQGPERILSEQRRKARRRWLL
jgi:hypothetical protein